MPEMGDALRFLGSYWFLVIVAIAVIGEILDKRGHRRAWNRDGTPHDNRPRTPGDPTHPASTPPSTSNHPRP